MQAEKSKDPAVLVNVSFKHLQSNSIASVRKTDAKGRFQRARLRRTTRSWHIIQRRERARQTRRQMQWRRQHDGVIARLGH